MIYLDTSVALAHLFNEPNRPGEAIWQERLVSSELLRYELAVRVNARGLSLDPVRQLVARVALLQLTPVILKRALEPFPTPVRTLDALHLASLCYLRDHGQTVRLASHDEPLSTAGVALGFALF